MPLVQITFLTSWAWSCPLGLKLPFLNLTELCTAALGRGAVGAMADHLGLNVSLLTPSPWDMPGLDTVLEKRKVQGAQLRAHVTGVARA